MKTLKILRLLIFGSLLLWAVCWVPLFHAHAQTSSQPLRQTASELINAVNDLRVSRGLGPLTVHPILMQTAQMQAEALLATGGAVGHTRPNGMTMAQQLLMLGYPLAGDLSQGGFRAENLVGGTNLTVAAAIGFWLSDAPHTNTMLSQNICDIGAGVAIGNDQMRFFVVDTALRTGTGLPQPGATAFIPHSGAAAGGATEDPESISVSQYILPVTVATALPNGDVFHKVLYGQSLWSIAIQYGTTIDQIRRLNHLGDNSTIHVGQVLLIRKKAAQAFSTATLSVKGTSGMTPSPPRVEESSATPLSDPMPTQPPAAIVPSGVIIVLTIISFGALIVLLYQGRQKPGE